MKLNYKNTIKVGFAFAIIMLFWNVYDFVVPLLLDNIYGLPDDIRGLIMGLDNLLSLFLLPLFGNISDKTKTKLGKRTPFIIVGTVVAAILAMFIPVTAASQFKEAQDLRTEIRATIDSTQMAVFYDNAANGVNTNYCDYDYLVKSGISRDTYINLESTNISVEGKDENAAYFKTVDSVKTQINKTEYDELKAENTKYNQYAKAGVNTYLANEVYSRITLAKPISLIIYMILLFFVLVAMATFRSPAVALMPDVTPKPLRSQANAVINLAGGFGGVIAFLIYQVWFAIDDFSYIQIFITMSVCMVFLLLFFLHFVKEPKLVDLCRKTCEDYGIKDEEEVKEIEEIKVSMDKDKKKSFILILGAIFMWFMGYNAVTSNLSIYTTRNLLFAPSLASTLTAVSMLVSAIAFIPVGYLAVKIGRKKSIMIGFALAVLSFFLTFLFVRQDWTRVLFAVFYLIAGFGLIIANVNTFPMVVELSKEGDIGKYTGFYYTATMSAQAITPYIAGLFMKVQAKYLFLYAAVCIIIAIVLMSLVKHGDSKAIPPKSKLELLGGDD